MNDATPVRGEPINAGSAAEAAFRLRVQEREEIPLVKQYWRLAVRWRWVILGSIAAFAVLGMIATLFMTPLYQATVTLEISRENSKVVNIQGVEPESSALDVEFYQTQYGLLESRSLAERVAQQLRLPQDEAFFEMFDESTDRLPLGSDRSPAAIRDARTRLAGQILLRHLDITPIRASRLVHIGFISPDPDFSVRVANAWADNFIKSNLERRFEATSYARSFLEGRLEQLRGRLDESERQLVRYAGNQRIINVATGSSDAQGKPVERPLVADDLTTLNKELAQATADRIQAQSRLSQVSSPNRDALPDSLKNEALNVLRGKRAEAAADYARVLTQFEPEYPPAKALASQVEQFDRSIGREVRRVQDSLRSQYEEARTREASLSTTVDALKNDLLDVRDRSIQYNIFQRDVDTNRSLYDGLLQRYKEIGVAGGIGNNNVSIVDRAQRPEKPARPRPLLNLLIALIAGAAVGAAIAFALEQIDEAITDPADLETSLNLPVLGAIPAVKDVLPREALHDRKSPMSEAFLSVQTSLEFSTEGGVPKSLAVTSTRAAEGKSTSAYAVATSLTRLGRRVLLVDADMRSPSVHGLLEVSNAAGLSNYLASGANVADLVQKSAIGNLSLLTSGPTPPNAAELLSGSRFSEFVEEASRMFDHVVVDAPPVLGLADAPLVASRVQGTIFVVEAHGARSGMIRIALQRLYNANARVLGAVLTKFDAKRSYLGYGYDYGYGYGGQTTDAG